MNDNIYASLTTVLGILEREKLSFFESSPYILVICCAGTHLYMYVRSLGIPPRGWKKSLVNRAQAESFSPHLKRIYGFVGESPFLLQFQSLFGA